MAFYVPKFPCPICDHPVGDDVEAIFCFPYVGIANPQFTRLDDACVHSACLRGWSERDRFVEEFNEALSLTPNKMPKSLAVDLDGRLVWIEAKTSKAGNEKNGLKTMVLEPHDDFIDVEMPRWYRRLAIGIRVLCIIGIVSVLIWNSPSKIAGFDSTGFKVVLVIVIVVIAMLPNIPKAYIEQRNRIRGLKDGSLMRHVEERSKSKDL